MDGPGASAAIFSFGAASKARCGSAAGPPRSPAVSPSGPEAQLNGIDVAAMAALAEAALVTDESTSATWEVVTTWRPGPAGTCGHTRSDYEDADEQAGPTPLEQLLSVANTCVILGLRVRCALEGLELHAIEVTASAQSGLRGLVHLPTAAPGLRSLAVSVALESDGAPERLDQIVEEVLATSPVLASLRQPVSLIR